MSTDSCVRWAKKSSDFWDKADDASVSPNIVCSYSCRSQTGEGLEELINSINSAPVKQKISHVHIWDTSYLYRHTIPEFSIYSDPSIPTKWYLANEKTFKKLDLPYTVHSWIEGLDSPHFNEWLQKIKTAFAGDENGEGIDPEFRKMVLSIAEDAVMRGNGTFSQCVRFILEECAYTCLYFGGGVIIYPTDLLAISYIVNYYGIDIQHLPYKLSNNATSRTHVSLDRNRINYDIVKFITDVANNVNFFVIDKHGEIIYKNKSAQKICLENDAKTLALQTWENSLQVMKNKQKEVVEEYDKGKYFLSIKSPLIVDDEVEGVIGLSVDITDSKKVEAEKKKLLL